MSIGKTRRALIRGICAALTCRWVLPRIRAADCCGRQRPLLEEFRREQALRSRCALRCVRSLRMRAPSLACTEKRRSAQKMFQGRRSCTRASCTRSNSGAARRVSGLPSGIEYRAKTYLKLVFEADDRVERPHLEVLFTKEEMR